MVPIWAYLELLKLSEVCENTGRLDTFTVVIAGVGKKEDYDKVKNNNNNYICNNEEN